MENVVSPLNQALFTSICNLLNKAVSDSNQTIWTPEKNIFMVGLHNNIIYPKERVYILIIRKNLASFMHQQAPMKNYSDKTLTRLSEESCSIELHSYCTSVNSIGYALEEALMRVFNQDRIVKLLQPFSILNSQHRIISNSEVKEIETGLFIIRHTFRFNLTYSQKSVTNFQTYDRIDEDINQLNIG